MPISDYGVYWVTSVVDYHSRYVLTCHFSPTHTAQDVIEALEKALEEASQLYVRGSEVITLVSQTDPISPPGSSQTSCKALLFAMSGLGAIIPRPWAWRSFFIRA